MFIQKQCAASGNAETYLCIVCHEKVDGQFYSISCGFVSTKNSPYPVLDRYKMSEDDKPARHKLAMFHPECFLSIAGDDFKFSE
jgi:hypothetical protein